LFLYRHRDLLEQLQRGQAAEPAGGAAGPQVSRESLRADLANAHERNRRLQARIQHLDRRLSEAMGEQAWRESGLSAAADIEAFSGQIVACSDRPSSNSPRRSRNATGTSPQPAPRTANS
jgi:hypothetical protein